MPKTIYLLIDGAGQPARDAFIREREAERFIESTGQEKGRADLVTYEVTLHDMFDENYHIRRNALAKLTDEEKAALGLKYASPEQVEDKKPKMELGEPLDVEDETPRKYSKLRKK